METISTTRHSWYNGVLGNGLDSSFKKKTSNTYIFRLDKNKISILYKKNEDCFMIKILFPKSDNILCIISFKILNNLTLNTLFDL